jgi:hypothetical protein
VVDCIWWLGRVSISRRDGKPATFATAGRIFAAIIAVPKMANWFHRENGIKSVYPQQSYPESQIEPEVPHMAARRRIILAVIGVIGVTVGVFARQPIWELIQPKPEITPPEVKLPPPSPPSKPVPTPLDIAKPHLTWAEKETERVVDEHLKALDGFFADAKKNTPAFAAEALSWGSKWRLIVDYVPYTRGGRHEEFMREKFEELIFTPATIEQAVDQIVKSYLQEVKSIEGTMLVRIKADVSDFPTEYPIATCDRKRLEEFYGAAIKQAIDAAKNDATVDVSLSVSSEVLSTIVLGVLRQVAIELGVSAGILGAGAGSAVETFGIGLVVGVIVDAIVSWVWDWYADPKGELAAKLKTKLDDIHDLIVNGSKTVNGLRSRLREIARERTRVRETAVITVLKSH